MARFVNVIAAEISGKLGGIVFSHNRGGPYMRILVTPVNPNTPAQSFIRTLTADLATAWVDTLAQSQRDGWNAYDENLPSQFGNRGGIGQFTRSNVPRGYASFPGGDPAYDILPIVEDAPTIFDVGGFTPVGVIAGVVGGVTLAFDDTDAWNAEDDAAMMIYMSPGQNPSITKYSRRMNLVGVASGNTAMPPPGPAVFASPPFPIILGKRYFFRVVVSRADGRYSAGQFLNSLAVA